MHGRDAHATADRRQPWHGRPAQVWSAIRSIPIILSLFAATLQAQENQPAVTSANASSAPGVAWTPSYSGGASEAGSYQFVVAGYTNWDSAPWSPSEAGSYSFYVRRLGGGGYHDSDPSDAYTLTVAKLNQPAVTSGNASVAPGVGWTPNYAGGASGAGGYQFVVSGKTNWGSSAWTPSINDEGPQTFHVRRLGNITYHDSDPSQAYTVTVARLNQSPPASAANAAAPAGLPWSPLPPSGGATGGQGTGAWEFSVLGHTNWTSSPWTPGSGTYYFYVRKKGDGTYADSISFNPATANAPINGFVGYYTLTAAKLNQAALSGANATIMLGSSWSPLPPSGGASGGSGSGAWQFVVGGHTDWPGHNGNATGQAGTLPTGASNASTTWTPPGTDTYRFWLRKLGDATYHDAIAINPATANATDAPPGYYLLTVNSPPSIVVQPQSVLVPQGASPTFSVQAAGSGPLSYQWYWNDQLFTNATGTPWTGWNTATLQIPAIQPEGAGTIKVLVSNPVGSVFSNTVTLALSQYSSGGTFYIRGVTYANGVTLQENHQTENIVAGDNPGTTAAEPVHVQSGANVEYVVGTTKFIRLTAGFRAHPGSVFRARLGTGSSSGGGVYALTIYKTGLAGETPEVVGNLAAGTTRQIVAASPPLNQAFHHWTRSGSGSIAAAFNASTTFTMGAGHATVHAIFEVLDGADDDDDDGIPNAIEAALGTASGITTVDSNNPANLKVHKPQ